MRASHLHLLVLLAVALSLIVAACGSGDDAATVAPQPTAAPQATQAPQTTQAPQATATARPANTPAPAPTATAVPRPQGTLNLAWTNLSNFQGVHISQAPQYFLDGAYDYIIGSTQDGKDDTVSGIVNNWSMSQDGTVWTLKTRDGIAFHNGDKASANDIKAWITFSASEGSLLSSRANLQSDVASIDVPDGNTAILNLKKRNIFWPFAFLGRHACGGNPCHLVDGEYLAKVGIAGYNKAPVGSGPFAIKEINIGDSMTFEAVDNHWFWGVPRIKTLKWTQVPEESTQIALLRNNGAQAINLSISGGAALKNERSATIYTRPGGTTNIRVE